MIAAMTVPQWDWERKFSKLKEVLSGNAEEAYNFLVGRDYPTPAEKMHANFVKLKCHIVTHMLNMFCQGT